MLPVITLVGRPNVGKSTLFNRLTRSRRALVADQPGLTRDRQYGVGALGSRAYLVVDTGGLSGTDGDFDALISAQVERALDEADHVIFLLDAEAGRSAVDDMIAARLRRLDRPVTAVVNKSDRCQPGHAAIDFHALGLGELAAISATQGGGVRQLIDAVLASLPDAVPTTLPDRGVQIAVIGRPNVGKSTLINRLLGEERVLAFDQPGTTRDSIHIPFERDGHYYTLIDTAGVRRRARIDEAVEKFSVIKALQAMSEANVVLLVLDAQQGIAEQDAHLAGHVLDSGRALVVLINKWDGLSDAEREQVRRTLERKLSFLSFAEWRFVSALHGSGVGHVLGAVDRAFAAAQADLSTPRLTEVLQAAVREHQPPLVRGRRIKLRYAHQGGRNPPLIVIHGNQTEDVPAAYRRYLANRFQTAFELRGTPVRLEFRTGENPFQGRRNTLTARQQRRRSKLIKHLKKRK